MSDTAAEAIARAVLYEGYLLYPYRPSSVKNRQAWSWGGLYPRAWAEAHRERWSLQCDVLVQGSSATEVVGRLRFLHRHQPGAEAIEHTIPFGPWTLAAETPPRPVVLAGGLHAEVSVQARPLSAKLWRLTVRATNTGAIDSSVPFLEAQAGALAAAHLILETRGGELVSLLEPPSELREHVAKLENEGVWPVLVGRPPSRQVMLASPIILYDYPQIAPESPGDLFDATEIDEILTLRILTLTDEEKREVRSSGVRAQSLLERTEALSPAQRAALHGAVRGAASTGFRSGAFQVGDRVRLRPGRRSDILDVALAGRSATVASIERDFEDQVYLTVTIDDDPGADLGLQGQPGHRFFFRPEEVEPR